ncbi:3-oxoacyl-[acyl-carrier-protein] reductase [Butyrivibrio hungatei DSM 14810]|uniref:3-oxoacyl-[acyl-carrier-protein] reductase n=1 Tax=Butyrivibrio hungatei DSM 14810 TaxID=1121132 RepID=A0A1M7T348_9FIRM|nr:3-oxoacyl-[acyl-carrier-protein] reductase [Butyrivibrio hungatei]SHN65183.1 3-oxoacyl-[acyl-carrier-protein] reductase [Butyrivibrio hungatei DSM 14810]
MMLEGKVAVISGGTRGIGNAIAWKFAEQGANLALIATSDSERNKKAVKELSETGRDVRLYICDVKDPEQVVSVAEEILADFGTVDVLVNNAGITRDNLLPSLSVMDIDDVIDVNLKGTIYLTRAFVRRFVKQRHGNIVNISSVVGLMGNKGQANYAASKAGIIGFTKTVAKEYGRRNIRCNAIAPGYIATEMTATLNEEQTNEIAKQLPLGRLGQPDDVADLALFLAGDSSRYITGEVIKVDGGMYV